MTKLLLAAAVAALCFAPAAFAAADPDPAAIPAPAKPAPKAKPDGNGMVCHYEQPVGSRLGGKRVCESKADAEARANLARDQMNHAPPGGPH